MSSQTIVMEIRGMLKKLSVLALLAICAPMLAQTPETIELPSFARGIAIKASSPDSDFGRFLSAYGLEGINGCGIAGGFIRMVRMDAWMLAINGKKFDTPSDFQRTRSYRDEPLLRTLRTPSAGPLRLLILAANSCELAIDEKSFDTPSYFQHTHTYHDESLLQAISAPRARPPRLLGLAAGRNVDAVYEVYFDRWDGKLLRSREGVKFVPEYGETHQLIRVSPDLLLKKVGSSGSDLSSAREAAARSEALYPSAPRVLAVRAALGEVIVKEILRRIEQAKLADSQNDWPHALSILREMFSEIPESHPQVASLIQSYYERGTQAEAEGNWEAAVSAFNKVLDVFPWHQQAQMHKKAIRERAVKECLSKAQSFESRKNYQAGLALLDRYRTYFPEDERLDAAHDRLAEASAREQARLAAAAADRKLQNQIDACTQQLNGHLYVEAARSVSDLVSNDFSDSRIRSLAIRAAQEIPPKSYESHAQAEKVIWSVQRLTPASALVSPHSGVRVDWHGNFEAKTIDNWYVVRSSEGEFVFKGSPATVALSPNQAVRVIGTVQGVERIGTLGGQPQQMVVVHAERID